MDLLAGHGHVTVPVQQLQPRHSVRTHGQTGLLTVHQIQQIQGVRVKYQGKGVSKGKMSIFKGLGRRVLRNISTFKSLTMAYGICSTPFLSDTTFVFMAVITMIFFHISGIRFECIRSLAFGTFKC